MEAFSLLKYWKSATVSGTSAAVTTTATTVDTSGDSDSDSDSDAGPFIDLEFAADVAEGEEHEVNERAKVVSLSPPSDELLFNGRIVEINGEDELSSEMMTSSSSETVMMTSKSGQFQVPASILRSATKLRVLMLGLKQRSKPESTQNQKQQQQQQSEHTEQQQNEKKQFAVKLKSLKVEEVPILSLLTRASSNSKHESELASVEEKRKKKEVMEKYYLKLVKPLVSKRNQQDHENVEMKMKMKTKKKKKKRLGKSKSAVVHSMMMMSTSGSGSGSGSKENENGKVVVVAKKRDDSLLEVQDGIQGAILHCKRSFNSSCSTSCPREQEGEEALPELSRSVSDPTHDKTAATTVTAEETAS